MKFSALLCLFIFTIHLTGCNNSSYRSLSSGTSPISTSDVQEVNCTGDIPGRVQIVARTFSPASETILQDEVVKWENNDSVIHTVTSGTTSAQDNIFNITLNPGEQRCLRFKRTRTYSYFCKIHPEMRGEILVR